MSLPTPERPGAHAAPPGPSGRRRARGLALVSPGALAALTGWLAFSSGGFFAGATGIAALAVGAALLLWTAASNRPLAAAGAPVVVLVAALSAFAAWTLLSGTWSGAPGRALVEFDRALLYVLVAALFGLAGPALGGARRLLWGLAFALVVVCACGLVTRLLPGVWPTSPTTEPDRLAFPVTYWNTLGLVAALGIVACLHVATGVRERPVARVLAAAAFPILATTLYFTYSRGGMGALAVGVVAYLVLARPRGALGTALAVLPTTAFALASAFGADALASRDITGPAAVDAGRSLALVVLGCVAAAAALRAVALPLDARLARLQAAPALRRRLAVAATVVAVVVVGGGAVALDAPARVASAYTSFVEGDAIIGTGDRRDRLGDAGNNGRLDHWRVALDATAREPLHGSGAGTYALLWARDRPFQFSVNDGHSLYVEVLGELGIVGLGVLLIGILALLAGTLRRAFGPDRAVGAAAFALVLMWALRAGVDWDWEMPVVTVPVLAVGAAAVATSSSPAGARSAAARARRAATLPRVVAGLGVLALLVTPWLVSTSQRHLARSVAALRSGDCDRGVDEALAATDSLGVRAEPFVVLGYCDARLGRPELGVRAFEAAVARDPANWEGYYGLALLRAAAGRDPRPAARAAVARNPLSPYTRDALERFRGARPDAWRRQARSAPLPI